MTFPLTSIAGTDYSINHVLVSDVLDVAKMKSNHFEQQLTRILATITGNSVDPRKLSCEERYAIFLHYLDLTHDQNDLNEKIKPSEYLSSDLESFSNARINGENGVTVRHLIGLEAEALEMGCENTVDWILGAMAITIGCEKLPAIDIPTSVEFCAKMIHARTQVLNSLETDEFNQLMADYLNAQYDQKHLVNMAFDQGIVLEKFDLRGADDAPLRFRPSIAFTGYCKDLLSMASRASAAV